MTASELIAILSVLPPETIIACETYVGDHYSSEDVDGIDYHQRIEPNQCLPDGWPPRMILH